MTPLPTVSVLAPVYNEEDVIVQFVTTVAPALEEGWELLVVDDGSTDATPALLEELGGQHRSLRVVTHDHNQGLGAALATGFAAARKDVVVTMDADLSHPIARLPGLVAACRDSDAVFASRFVPSGSMVGVPRLRRWISRFGNLGFRLLFWSPVWDMTTGYRAYRRDVLSDLELTSAGFEAQMEISIRLISRGRRIAEVPLQLKPRVAGASKMRYLQILPLYARMTLRMLALRWWRRGC
jgi:dolichol-phosphate mannosyltransferase